MVTAQAQLLIDDLENHQEPERGNAVRNYMKTSALEFLGVPLPIIRKIAKEHSRNVAPPDFNTYLCELWNLPIFDVRRAAVEVLLQFQKRGMSEVQIMSLVDIWIGEIDTWALTDPLAWIIGKLILEHPQLRNILKDWGVSDNFWRRRMAIVPFIELCMRGQYKKEYGLWILEAVTPHLSDKEFFVAKAVGWVLRQLSVHEPEIVRQFISNHKNEMNQVAYREGSRKL